MFRGGKPHNPGGKNYIKDSFERHINLLKFLGVKIEYGDTFRRKWALSDYLLIISIFLVLSLSCASQIMALIRIDGNISSKGVNVIFLMLNLSTAFKLLLMQFNSDSLAKLLAALRTEGVPASSPILIKIKTITEFYLVITFAILAMFAASPWLSGKRALPIKFWFPFETKNFLHFLFSYFCLRGFRVDHIHDGSS